MPEQSRKERICQTHIPTRAQVEGLSELIRHVCFTNRIEQTILCDWTPIAMIPDVTLWDDHQNFIREAEADFQDNVNMNLIGMDLEHYDWEEWNNTEYLGKITTFFERVNFFLPSLFLQLGHENLRFQHSWSDEAWRNPVPMMTIRYYNSLRPHDVDELQIPKAYPFDNLKNILGVGNEYRINDIPAEDQIIEEGTLIEIRTHYPFNEFLVQGRIFDPSRLRALKELFQRTVSTEWVQTLKLMGQKESEDQL
jgi:hypothetical protein